MNKERTLVLTRGQVEALRTYRPSPYLVTTLYLDVTGAFATGGRGVLRRLVREARAGLAERELTRKQRQSVEQDLAALERIVRDARVRAGRSVAAFLCSGADYEQVVDLPHPVKDRVVVGETPFVRPLAVMLDEYPRYLVVLVDRAQARLLAVHMGWVRALVDVSSDVPQRVKEAGYAGFDERRIERHIDDHVLRHYKKVAGTVRELVGEREYDMLILGGPAESVAGLKEVLNPSLRRVVAGEVEVEVAAPADKVLEACQSLVARINAKRDRELMKKLEDAVESDGTGVTGMAATLGALRRGAISGLLVLEGHEEPGFECPGCGFLSPTDSKCPACGETAMRKVPRLVTEVIDRATEGGAEVWHISSEPAASRLGELGGIAALLRFRLV